MDRPPERGAQGSTSVVGPLKNPIIEGIASSHREALAAMQGERKPLVPAKVPRQRQRRIKCLENELMHLQEQFYRKSEELKDLYAESSYTSD